MAYWTNFRARQTGWRLSLLLGVLLVCPVCFAQSAKNPGVVEIADPQSFTQIIAVSDVHGMHAGLLTLLRAANVVTAAEKGRPHWNGKKTLLIVCGDSIDKGPDSLPVLLLWRQLMREAPAQGGRVVILLGNHEAEFLVSPNSAKAALFADELHRAGLEPTDVAKGTDKKGVGDFLRAMPVAARVGTYLFSHAGWFPAQTSWSAFTTQAKSRLAAGKYDDAFLTGPHSILEEKEETLPGSAPVKWYDDPASVRSLEQRVTALSLYGTVFGHQPHAFGFLRKIGGVDGLRIIKIDSGMAPAPDGDGSTGELLRFPNPKDLLRFAPPTVERILPNGTHAKIKALTVDSPEK